jgi:hypothetical protein
VATQTIDIPLPPSLSKLAEKPICIPVPKPGKVEVNMPMGGSIKGIVDATKAIPNDCSLSFSLVLQLQPILVNLDCLFKIVKVLQPMIDVVTGLAHVPPQAKKVADAIPKLLEAVPPLVDCIAKFVGLGIPLFIRDLLMLVAKILRCISQQLRSVLNVMSGLALQIGSAQADGNTELLATLQCAQENAQNSAAGMMSSIDPVLVLLSMVEPFLGLANVDPIKTPQIGSDTDLESLQTVVTTLEDFAKTLEFIAKSLGAQ